jgi:TOBE domain
MNQLNDMSPPDCPAAAGSGSMKASNHSSSYTGRPVDGEADRAEHVMKLSARNQIPARVTGIQAGEAIAIVELDANGVRMVASITWRRSSNSG